jgi:hypothetical protein
VLGVLVTVWIVRTRPQRLDDMERVYVDDEPVTPETLPAFVPEA